MFNKVYRTLFILCLLLMTTHSVGQHQPADPDLQAKEALYKKYRKEVLAYDKKEFDALFLEFFKKQNDKSTVLTKDEFYTYTIKIVIYSEKLGLLYKDQKAESQQAKKEWFDRSYSDYLNFKK